MTAIKKILGSIGDVAKKVWTSIKNVCSKIATTCSQMKNKYVYLFAAFVVLVAILAGVGAGLYESVEAACEKLIHAHDTVSPNATEKADYDKFYEIYRKVYPALRTLYGELSES